MLEASRLKDIDFLWEYTEVAGNTSSLSYLRNDRPVLCCIVHLFIRKSLKYDDDFVVSDADKPKVSLAISVVGILTLCTLHFHFVFTLEKK